MKKYLFLISSVALLASCSNELMIEESTSSLDQATKGLTFQVTETKGQMNNDGTSFFFAEYDHVNVYANNAREFIGGGMVNDFDTAYTYKATRSKGNPFLTGVNDDAILEFAKYNSAKYANNTSEFVLIYPEKVKMAQSVAPTAKDSITKDKKSYPKFYITGVDNKTQKSGAGKNMNIDSKFMIGKAVKIVDASTASYESVGENLDINLRTPFAMIYYSFKDLVDGKYDFGNLNTISIYPADSAASPVALGSYKAVAKDSVRHLIKDQVYTAQYYYQPTLGEFALENSYSLDTVTLNVGEKLTNDNVLMNAFILPAERTSKENYTVTYTFDKVTLTLPVSVSYPFEANTTYPIALSIADKFPYILTNEDETTGLRTLYINSGEVSAISDGDKLNPQIMWASAVGGKVPFNKIEKIIIAPAVKPLKVEDYKLLNNCVNTKSLMINNESETISNLSNLSNLEILEAPFVKTVASYALSVDKIVKLNLPSVTSYQDSKVKLMPSGTADKSFKVLKDLNLGSYDFKINTEATPEVFFNSDTKKTLKTVDIHSVKSLSPIFGYERDILFTDYKALVEIALNSDTTIISANEFKNCTSLKTVTGCVEMTTADSAFANCPALTSVSILGDVIPIAAFNGDQSLTAVYSKDGKTLVAPTWIGSNAFNGAEYLKYMDLSKATNIGVSAFKGATSFVGKKNAKNGVVNLIVNEVSENAFAGTAVERFQLLNAINMEANSLDSKALKQVKIRQAITGSTAGDFAPDHKSKVQLFVINKTEADKYLGYYSVTIDDSTWED